MKEISKKWFLETRFGKKLFKEAPLCGKSFIFDVKESS